MNISLTKAAQIAAGVMAALAIALAARFALAFRRLPSAVETNLTASLESQTPVVVMPTAEEWSIFRTSDTPARDAGPLVDRFRLAGTFFLYGDEAGGGSERRLAIIDALSERKQIIVSEGQEIAGYTVMRIELDRVRLSRGADEFELALSFSAVSSAASIAPHSRPPEAPSMEDLPALESSRFGKRVGENRWVIRREELLRYYAELLDDPERIANVYASLKPLYEENSIAGYVLDPEGEEDFFRAVGLQAGDVIRRVNSMRMVSQRRAEYFISEFMKNRVNAFVIDLERGDREEKLIYLIR